MAKIKLEIHKFVDENESDRISYLCKIKYKNGMNKPECLDHICSDYSKYIKELIEYNGIFNIELSFFIE